MKRIGIVGGGVAGLAAAWELARLGFSVELFESSGSLGGLASSFDFDGLRIERFYHFICRHDRTLLETCGRLGIADKLSFRAARTAFFYAGRTYPFGTPLDLLRFGPLSLVDKLRFGLNVLYSRRFTHWPILEDLPAREWLIRQLGRRGYDVIWDPLLRVKFDEYHGQISAAWMWHRIHRVATSRRFPWERESLGFLRGGSETLVSALEKHARAAGAVIRLNSQVAGIWTEAGRCRGLLLGSEGSSPRSGTGQPGSEGSLTRAPFDQVICAVPLPVFVRLLPEDQPEYRARLEAIRFIGVVCMILKLKRPLTRNFWLNIHDPRISVNGLIEYTNLTGTEACGGRSIVYVPYYLERTRPRYSYADEDLYREYLAALQIVGDGFTPDSVEGYRVFRAPFAQPICHTGFSQVMPPAETPWPGCWLIESTQLYPADRVISGTIRLAQDVVLKILDRSGMAGRAPFRPRQADEIPA